MSSFDSQLKVIPGVGDSLARMLNNIGISRVAQLKDADPEKLYEKLCDYQASPVDRCVLYVFRCAVYYASNEEHELDKLKWWKWKD